MQGLHLPNHRGGDLPGAAQLDSTGLQHAQGIPGALRDQRAFVAGHRAENRQKHLRRDAGPGVDAIADRDEFGIFGTDVFDDRQQVQGAPSDPIDLMRIDDVAGLKLLQQRGQPGTSGGAEGSGYLFDIDVPAIHLRVMPEDRVDLGLKPVGLIQRAGADIGELLGYRSLPDRMCGNGCAETPGGLK